MSDRAAIEAIAKAPIFSGLSNRALKSISSNLKARDYLVGEEVVTEGEQGIGFFVIMSGLARVEVDGRPVKTLIAGDTFGETALFTKNHRRTATVVAETDLKTYAMTAWQLIGTVHAHPEVGIAISRQMAERLNESHERRVSAL